MKKLLAILLALIMILTAVPALWILSSAQGDENRADVTWSAGSTVTGALSNLTDGSASTRVDFNDWSTASGKCTNFYWKLKDGVLSVVGSGDLLSTQSVAYAGFPWYTRGEEIETVILTGFTTIGTGAFYSPQNSLSYKNIKKFIVSEGTTTIQDSALGIYNGKMNYSVDLYLPSTLETVANRAFRSINSYIGNVYVSPALDADALTVGTNNPTKLMNKEFVTASYGHLTATAYEWENSDGCTELKVGLKDAANALPVPAEELGSYLWKVSITSHDFGKTIVCTPSSVDGNGVYRFRTCLGEGEDQFIPRYYIVSKAKTANDYGVQVDICDKTTGEVLYRSEFKNGYVFPATLEPIYPDDHQGLYYLNGSVYIEGDLGGQYTIDSLEVYCYRATNRFYKFTVVASNDNTLPASAWTWLGTQSEDAGSTNDGYTVRVTDPGKYQYVRIYPVGQYGAGGNSGFHFTDVFVNIKPGEVYVDPYEQFGGTAKRLTTAAFHSVGFETWPFADNGVWSNRAFFQAVMTINGSEEDFKANCGTPEYEYVWQLYARDKDVENADWDGPFTAPMETMNNGSVYYRVQPSNCPEGDLCAAFEVGHTYEIVFDVLKDDEHQGFALLTVTWTQKHQDNHDLYIDFWNNHARLDGYRTGDQPVTPRDAAVASALGFSETGAYAAAAHVHDFEEAPVPATCVTTAKTGSVCRICGMIGEVYEEGDVDLTAHVWGAWETVTEPTVDAEGEQKHVCTLCGAEDAEAIPCLPRPVKEGGETYCYSGEDRVTGWVTFDGREVYFKKSTGTMIRYPEAVIGGKTYAFETFDYNGLTLWAGALKETVPADKNGLVKESDGVRCYENGVAFTGWKEIDGKQVYFKKDGLMIRYPEAVIGGTAYVFTSFTFDGFTLWGGEPKAAPVKNGLYKEPDGVRYYENGVMKTGWVEIDGNTLYFKSNGLMNRYGAITINGVQYLFRAYATFEGVNLYKLVYTIA